VAYFKILSSIFSGTDTAVGILFPLLGLLVLLMSLGYLFYAVDTLRHYQRQKENQGDSNSATKKEPLVNIKKCELLSCMVILLGMFFFLYGGAEYTYGQYLTPFVAKSDLNRSKVEGTHATAIFWGNIVTALN